MGRFAACGRKGRSCESTCLALPPVHPTVSAKPSGCLCVSGDLRVPSSSRSRRSADGTVRRHFRQDSRIGRIDGILGPGVGAQKPQRQSCSSCKSCHLVQEDMGTGSAPPPPSANVPPLVRSDGAASGFGRDSGFSSLADGEGRRDDEKTRRRETEGLKTTRATASVPRSVARHGCSSARQPVASSSFDTDVPSAW